MIHIKIDKNIGVIFTLHGEFSFNEIFNEEKLLFDSPDFSKLRYLVVDRTIVTNYDLTIEQVKTLAGLFIKASKVNNSLVHILVSKSDLQYGMANMFSVYGEDSGWAFKNFRETKEAYKWIEENIHS